MPNVTFSIFDETFSNPLVADISINGGAPTSGSVQTINITPGPTTISIQASGRESINLSLNIPIYFAYNQDEFNFVLYPIDYTDERSPVFAYFQNYCSSNLTFYPNTSAPNAQYTWLVTESYSSFNPVYEHSFKTGFLYKVYLNTFFVINNEEFSFNTESEVAVFEYLPKVSFITTCVNPEEEIKNNPQFLKNCIQSCQNCDCEDISYCRCVQPSQPFYITLKAKPSNTFCNENTISVTLNGIEIYNQTFEEEINDYIEVTSETPGLVNIKATVSNCCGECFYEDQISVGPYETITKISCNNYSYNNYLAKGDDKYLIEIKDLHGNLIQSYVKNIDTILNFSLPSDGVYLFSSHRTNEQGDKLTNSSFILYSFCKIIECYTHFINSIICKNCDCKETKEEFKNYYKLLKFKTIIDAYFASIDIQYGTDYGVLQYSPQHLNSLKQHEYLLKAAYDICEICIKSREESNVQINTGGCSSCS
jgi:hypothetical protein